MSRPREFNEEKVLDAIMETFWSSGYEHTSAQDLVKATKLGRGSLYGAYGNKETLFKLALIRYQNHTRACVGKLKRTKPIAECLYDLLYEIAFSELDITPKRGCLVTNTAIEITGQDKRINELVRENFRILQSGIYNALLDGQEKGEIGSSIDAKQLSLFILTSIQGLRVIAKTSSSEDASNLISIIENILSVIFKGKKQ